MILRRGAALVAAAFCLLAGTPVAAVAAGASPQPPLVVLLAVPGLQWSDVANMPTLRRFAEEAAVGELSVKTSGGITRCSPGILAVTAGNRTLDINGRCPIHPSDWPRLQESNQRTKYRTTIGLLGTALQRAGVATITAGDLARPLLANEDGRVDTVAPSLRAALSTARRAPSGIATRSVRTSMTRPDRNGVSELRVENFVVGSSARSLTRRRYPGVRKRRSAAATCRSRPGRRWPGPARRR